VDAPASDLTLMAMSGIMHMVGDPDRPPLKLPVEQAYALAGIQGAIAALTALNARANDGLGQRAWVSAYQSAVLAGYRDPIVWEWTGRIGQRTGNRLVRGKSGVRQVWETRDGYVTWSLVDNPGMVRGMVALMAADGAAGPLAEVDWDNVLLADAPQEQIGAWEAVLEAWFRTKTKDELSAFSAEKGLGLSKIDTPQEALDSAHWAARGFWRRLKDEGRGLDLPFPGPLFRTTAVEPQDPAPAPETAQ
jgi:crotonobetainyl-CoA:carnitine CoA-transferase CaiB-like acyl-CoA transferase